MEFPYPEIFGVRSVPLGRLRSDSPKTFRVAFAFVVPLDTTPSVDDVAWVARVARSFETAFDDATRGHGRVGTALFETTRDLQGL